MRNKRIIYLKLFAIFSFLFSGSVLAQKVPKNFNIFFEFGFHKKDATIYDSEKNKLFVHGIDSLMIFDLKLSVEEKKTIYKEIQKINFIDYPEKYVYKHFDTAEVFIDSACEHYFLTVLYKNNSKKVEWDNCVETRIKDENHVVLMKLGRLIEKIIWAKNPLKDYHPTRMRFDPN